MCYFRTLNRRVVHTEGIKHFAESNRCWWLIDAIVSHIGCLKFNRAVAADRRIGECNFWTLTVADSSAVLSVVADSDCEPFITQVIEFTDLPDGEYRIWAENAGEFWVLLLPEEH